MTNQRPRPWPDDISRFYRDGAAAGRLMLQRLRGRCGQRQVPGAEVAVVTSGLYPQCGAMVLTA
ncbi:MULTISPECIES: hypothetical protein [unclassified Pseudofrankia]|uniref:hypothetical protein n=1 Tax=unclassified Pseudofrankia TaxID=2994372 RepID=UPI0008D91CA5|nr:MULTISPECIES: hypothetical protein [unclassified Pseudofrankia]MDT3443291.1 hypothetical protein [Pseudofrankia sp. BMG5.37]OHV65368.1 hypothetical protein BCD48_04625 [Pseudofrankia sp. BMG5.36]